MSRRIWAWARLLSGAAVLAIVVWRVGAGPFLDGVKSIDARALIAAVVITGFTTVCCAWRWRLISERLGADLPMRAAIGRYYLSQFLNSTLPGGILGDVHRGARHGRDTGDVGRGLRAAAWDRIGGQTVQITVTLLALTLLPSPVRQWVPAVCATLVVIAAAAIVARSGRRRASPGLRARPGSRARRVWPGVAVSSVAAMTGHLAIFLIAAHAAGVTVAPARMVGLGLLVLAAMSVPLNIAGWGLREGAAAWAFAAAGLGAGQGVAVAAAYGVLSLAACLPGAIVLVAGRRAAGRVPGTAPGAARDAARDAAPQSANLGNRRVVSG